MASNGIAVAPRAARNCVGLGRQFLIEDAIAQMLCRIDIGRAVRNPHDQIGLGPNYAASLHQPPLAIRMSPKSAIGAPAMKVLRIPRLRGVGAIEELVDRFFEVLAVEGLGQIGIHPGGQALRPVIAKRACGERQDRDAPGPDCALRRPGCAVPLPVRRIPAFRYP